MARSDLIVGLVSSGLDGNKEYFGKVVEAIIAEERAARHLAVAQQLEDSLRAAKEKAQRGLVFIEGAPGCYEAAPKLKFSDLTLSDETLSSCLELVEEQRQANTLRACGLEPRNRVLLIGPPGNGKTSLAEAIASELAVPLVVVRYDALIGCYLGETAAQLRKVFDHAASQRCVLFFDEFETLAKERGDLHETGELKRIVSSLLLQLDGLLSHTVAVAATNHPEMLDRAARRRFQLKIEMPNPDAALLERWFEAFRRRVGTDLGLEPADLARRFAGASFSDVAEFGMTARRRCALGGQGADMSAIISRALKSLPAFAAGPDGQSQTTTPGGEAQARV